MTLRQALQIVDLNTVYKFIHKKNLKNAAKCDHPKVEQVINQYSGVVTELLSLPSHKPYKYPWCIQYQKDWYDKRKYINVCLYNPTYVKPDPSLKPHGRIKKEKVPTGHYDCNADKHNKFFAVGFTSWNNIIDSEIIISIKISLEKAIAELLWELTFYGWTNKKVKENIKKLEYSLEESLKEIGGKTYTVAELDEFMNDMKSNKKK